MGLVGGDGSLAGMVVMVPGDCLRGAPCIIRAVVILWLVLLVEADWGRWSRCRNLVTLYSPGAAASFPSGANEISTAQVYLS